MTPTLSNLIWVMLGGALGAGGRYLMGLSRLTGLLGTTWIVNILGSVFLGGLMALIVDRGGEKP